MSKTKMTTAQKTDEIRTSQPTTQKIARLSRERKSSKTKPRAKHLSDGAVAAARIHGLEEAGRKDQVMRIRDLKIAGLDLLCFVSGFCPEGPERTAALSHLVGAVTQAVLSVSKQAP